MKKLLSILLVASILVGSFSAGFCALISQAREIGVGGGAESFNPVKFSVAKDVLIGTDILTTFNVEITDRNYKVKINSMSAYVPYGAQDGSLYLDISYQEGDVISGAHAYNVTGSIDENVNSIVRYTIEYDILDSSNNTVWKDLTGYSYAFISGSSSKTGALGAYHSIPGNLSDGCYFAKLDTLSTIYVQQSELTLTYRLRTQSAWNYHDPRTRGVEVISGNAPATFKTMPDAANAGQMDWPKCGAVERKVEGNWAKLTEPTSGYYNFTISFNSWNDEWENPSNITETTEMYYITAGDKANALAETTKYNSFEDGYYVQKGKYTEATWNSYVTALDELHQVAYALPNANYGYKVASSKAANAVNNIASAFAGLEEAEHDFYAHKDPVVVEATCTEAGYEYAVCICGEERTVVIPALGHDTNEWTVVLKETCTEKGMEELVCARCNEVIETRVIPAIKHNYQAVVTDPTCDNRGYTTKTCLNCGDSYISDYVNALGHKYVAVVTQPTCTEQGYTTYTCQICDYEMKDKYVEARGHKISVDNAVEPTCVDTGLTEGSHCSRCGEVLVAQDVVPALGHNEVIVEAVLPTCTEKGLTEGKQCSLCGLVSVAQEEIPALGHTEGEVVTVDATAIKDGSKTVYCKDCDAVLSSKVIPMPTGKLVVTAQSGNNTILTGIVNGDYEASLSIPKGIEINANSVTGAISMTDVSGLGINGTRAFEKVFVTGVDKNVLLSNYLPAFTGATISGLVDGKEYGFVLTGTDGDEEYRIDAVPQDKNAVAGAWAAFASHISTTVENEDGFDVIIPGNAYIQVGKEKLTFVDEDSLFGLNEITSDAVVLSEAEELEDAQIEIFLPAGTCFKVGNSTATLVDNATIKLYGYTDSDDINNIISMLSECQSDEEHLKTIVLFVNDFVNAIDGNDIVLNIEFSEPGVIVTGTVESFNDETATVELVLDGEIIQSVTVEGAGKQEYSFDRVFDGTYTIRVSKLNHATREYEINVDGEEITENLKIHLLGDINGDGKVNTLDVARTNAHAKSVSTLSDYEFKCADTNGDNRVNTLDVARINAHAKSVSKLW